MSGWQQERKYQTGIEAIHKNRRRNKDETGKTKVAGKQKMQPMITINLNAELFWSQLDPTCKDMPKTLSLGQYGMTRGVDRILKKYWKNVESAQHFLLLDGWQSSIRIS